MHFMDQPTNALAAAIGARIRQERNALRWTLDRLAEAAGVSRRMLVNVEQGAANPSVGTLLRISDALGIGLPALVEPPARSAVRVTRAGHGSILWRGQHGGTGVLVAGTPSPDVVELWHWTLGSGDVHTSEAHAPGTRELLQVQQGTLDMTVGDETHTLAEGDAITFSGETPHSYRNPGQTVARFVLAVFEPNVVSK
jgi:transcriptional regulator with XRE-family HTH domain